VLDPDTTISRNLRRRPCAGLPEMCPYSQATERIHRKTSIVLLIDDAESGFSSVLARLRVQPSTSPPSVT
jgi:hypothetical protein